MKCVKEDIYSPFNSLVSSEGYHDPCLSCSSVKEVRERGEEGGGGGREGGGGEIDGPPLSLSRPSPHQQKWMRCDKIMVP